ncbi:TPA: GNAT family N-acetyltransferase [Candidatus Micrarchaeota archaeon]|nr:GNAT family N-acetyltransferase [Candidatus Micrarchaeota archaeon]
MGHIQYWEDKIKIRPMRKDELIEVTKLIHSIFPESNAETRIEKDDKVLIAVTDGRFVGFIHFSGHIGTSGSISIKAVGVITEFRSTGVGSALIKALSAKYGKPGKPIYLKVSQGNESALALYEKEGFMIKKHSKSGEFFFLAKMPEN